MSSLETSSSCCDRFLMCIVSDFQEIPENAADIAHLAVLHEPGLLSGVDLRYTKSRIWDFFKHTWKVSAPWRLVRGWRAPGGISAGRCDRFWRVMI